MVKDIAPIGGSNPFHTGTSVTPDPAVIGNTVFFRAYESNINGYELWKSDGTAVGTVMVKDINTGSEDSYQGSIMCMGSTLFFTVYDFTQQSLHIWKTDGTAAGTVVV